MNSKTRFKGYHHPKEIMLLAVRWYLTYPLSYRMVEEMIDERGTKVDHATINRWVVFLSPILEDQIRKRKRAVSKRWHMDETYIKIKEEWFFYYRAVDDQGATIDYYLSKARNTKAAYQFLKKASQTHGIPDRINIDGSSANKKAIKHFNAYNNPDNAIKIYSRKFCNQMIEQDHRFIKRLTRPMMNFKSFSANSTLKGMEVCHMLRKKQVVTKLAAWREFYTLLQA